MNEWMRTIDDSLGKWEASICLLHLWQRLIRSIQAIILDWIWLCSVGLVGYRLLLQHRWAGLHASPRKANWSKTATVQTLPHLICMWDGEENKSWHHPSREWILISFQHVLLHLCDVSPHPHPQLLSLSLHIGFSISKVRWFWLFAQLNTTNKSILLTHCWGEIF